MGQFLGPGNQHQSESSAFLGQPWPIMNGMYVNRNKLVSCLTSRLSGGGVWHVRQVNVQIRMGI